MLSVHDARQLTEQALAGQVDRILATIDREIYQAASRGEHDVYVIEPPDSRVLDAVSKAGYRISYFRDDGGFYHVSW